MASIVELWKTNRDFLSDKKLQQILSFTGEGKLKDENDTSQEFREYLHSIPNERLIAHARECLQESFQDSGLALQDVVNEMGFRLGLEIQSGVYRGRVNGIGFDGIWRGEDNHHLVVEVETTDATASTSTRFGSWAQYRWETATLHRSIRSARVSCGSPVHERTRALELLI
jgi:hypothetical protein